MRTSRNGCGRKPAGETYDFVGTGVVHFEIRHSLFDIRYSTSHERFFRLPGRREVGAPSEWFRGRYTSLDAAADGNRFLVLKPIERPEALPLIVWFNTVEEFGAR